MNLPLSPGQWPEAMEQGRVSDAVFATAYARTGDAGRAWIKTGLAAVYAALGGPLPALCQRRDSLGHDLLLTTEDAPLDFVVLVCGRDFLSPARLVAAVVPALCARVPEVAAVRLGGSWPGPLLTALELCGVETACRLGGRDLPGVLAALPAKGRGAVVVLGAVTLPANLPHSLTVQHTRHSGRIGVFGPANAGFACDALTFAHPDMAFVRHGGPCPELPAWTPGQGGLAEAADCGYAAVCAPPQELAAALVAAPLALAPGRETFWLWPGLPSQAFRVRRLGAAVVGPQSDVA
jgi:hypothetical protein